MPDQITQETVPLPTVEPVATTEPVTSSSSPFKVGDEVRVLFAERGTPEESIGKKLTIRNFFSDSNVDLSDGYCYNSGQLAPAKYVPAVGDVVEFEYEGDTYTGVMGPTDSIAAKYMNTDGGFTMKMAKNRRFTGQRIDGIDSWSKALVAAHRLAQPTFKKGDKVKIVRKQKEGEGILAWSKTKDAMIGNVYEISRIDSDNEAVIEEWCFPLGCLELVK